MLSINNRALPLLPPPPPISLTMPPQKPSASRSPVHCSNNSVAVVFSLLTTVHTFRYPFNSNNGKQSVLTSWTVTTVGVFVALAASAAILTGTGVAGDVLALAVVSCVALVTCATARHRKKESAKQNKKEQQRS